MSNDFKRLEPQIIWNNFSALNAIPRASKSEESVIQFIKTFGEKLGLETIEDKTGNVLIKKPASLGLEGKPTIILQGHLDMVHQKNAGTDFDFATQGIDMYIDGDWVRARGTTLGADNGIGVAAIMSVLASNDIAHPSIEAIFTVDEEVGMTGAMGLEKDFLSGSILLNLDSEEDDALTIGSAGGVDVDIDGHYNEEKLDASFTFHQLTVNGLTGGHSGVDIHKGRSNAIKSICRLLYELDRKLDIRIASINGGDLTNAIPRECMAIVAIKITDLDLLKNMLASWTRILQEENQTSDPDLNIEIQEIEKAGPVLSRDDQKAIIASLYTCPNGIHRMTPGLDNLVQSSNNVAKINLNNGTYKVRCHTRSSIDSERNDLVNVIQNSFVSTNASIKEIGAYPGWKPQPNTRTLAIMKKAYSSLYGQEPKIYSIHAGLECGILAETYPDLEIISFGPNITGAHSPDEALQISSTQKFWSYLTKVLKEF